MAITVRDGSTDRTVRCDLPSGTLLEARLAPAGSVTRFVVVCTDGEVRADGFQVSLQVLRPTLATGTYALSSTDATAMGSTTFGVAVTEGGAGFAVGATASSATAFTGTLTIDEAGVGAGSRLRGSFTIAWARVGTITSGTVTGATDRSGGLAAAFDKTQ